MRDLVVLRNVLHALILFAGCCALLAGCGGSSKTLAAIGETGPPSTYVAAGTQWTDSSGLPGIPPETYLPTVPQYHRISATQQLVFGTQRLTDYGAGNYEVAGEQALVLVPEDKPIALAWALYAVTDLTTERPAAATFAIDSAPQMPGGAEPLPLSCWIGIANHTTGQWEWHGPVTTPSSGYSVVLSEVSNGVDIRDRYINEFNALYMLVITYTEEQLAGAGNPNGLTAARVNSITLDTLNPSDTAYRATRPHYAAIQSIGGNGAAGAKQTSALNPAYNVTLNWHHVADQHDPDCEALKYYVTRTGPDGPALPIGVIDAPAEAFTDPLDNAAWVPAVEPGATYVYKLHAFNDNGVTPESSATYTIPLLAPSNVEASDGWFTDKISLTWTKADYATGYIIYRDGQDAGNAIAVVGDVDTFEDTGITDFASHSYAVRSTNQYLPQGGMFSTPDDGWLSNGAPVAHLAALPPVGIVPLTVELVASGSYDPDDGQDPGVGIVKYEWDFEGDGVFDFDSDGAASTTHEYTGVGTYYPVVRVTDNEGAQSSASARVKAALSLPALSLTNPPLKGSGRHDDPFQIAYATAYVFQLIDVDNGDVTLDPATSYEVAPPEAGSISNTDATLTINAGYWGIVQVTAEYDAVPAAPAIYLAVGLPPSDFYLLPDPADADWDCVYGAGFQEAPFILDNVDYSRAYSFIANTQPDGSGEAIDVSTLTWTAYPPFIVVFDAYGINHASQFTSGFVFASGEFTVGGGLSSGDSNYVYVMVKSLPD